MKIYKEHRNKVTKISNQINPLWKEMIKVFNESAEKITDPLEFSNLLADLLYFVGGFSEATTNLISSVLTKNMEKITAMGSDHGSIRMCAKTLIQLNGIYDLTATHVQIIAKPFDLKDETKH